MFVHFYDNPVFTKCFNQKFIELISMFVKADIAFKIFLNTLIRLSY